MADTENKDIDFNKAKAELDKKDTREAKAKKPHSKKSFGWWAGVIILILISITFILPATGISFLFMDDSIEFGRYDGEPIAYENGSYMYNQYINLYTQYGGYMDSNSLLYQAYYNAVLNLALTQKAEKVGFYVSDEMVNRGIIESGYYNDENGLFDEALYEATGVSERTGVYNSVRQQLPTTTVVGDISSVLSSKAEEDFVAAMASEGRTFEYVAFDSSIYPDDLCIGYANSNPQPFTLITASVVSASTQEEADSIKADSALFDSTLAEQEGAARTFCFYELEGLGEENANLLFSTAQGELAGPYLNGSSYEVYRIESSPSVPDFSDGEILAKVREYIGQNAPEVVSEWAAQAAQDFYTAAQEDFDAALGQYGYGVQSVSFTPAGNGASALLAGFQSTDAYGLLYSAASADEAYNRSLFTSADYSVLAPQAAGDAYIVTRTGAMGEDSSQAGFVSTFYDYLSSSLAQSDLQNAILTSDLFEDDFYTVLIERLIQNQ